MSSLQNKIPIGILTRNRPMNLYLTLRSLMATKLPVDVKITIYDDASDLQIAREFLYSSQKIPNIHLSVPDVLAHNMPDPIRTVDLYGIKDYFKVVSMRSHQGVFHASLEALRDLLRGSYAKYVCLLQDDILFIKDWYIRMTNLAKTFNPGILGGISFGCATSECNNKKYSIVKVQWTQAQCLFIARDLLEIILPELQKFDSAKKNHFDLSICDTARMHGYNVLVTQPHVCQHIGDSSLVQPNKCFSRKGGRYSKNIYEPLVLAKNLSWFS